jgi:superfamily II DNA or RNA helicase
MTLFKGFLNYLKDVVKMAISIILKDLSEQVKREITKELIVNSSGDIFGFSKSLEIYPFDIVDEKEVYLPFYYGNQKLKKYPNDEKKFTQRNLTFTGILRDYQKEVVQETIKRFNLVRCYFIAMATGKGKTLTSIFLASRLKVKTCVLLHRVNLFDQWKISIEKMIPGVKIQILDSREPINPDNDFYLINPINVLKRNRKDFLDIGFLIADEAHALCSEKMSKSLLWFTPKYCLGLSATPERSDALDKIIDLHFGNQQIKVPLFVEHTYYRFNTEIIPETKINARGVTDWTSLLAYQANHPQRNLWIVQLCTYFSKRNILVLCKRKDQTLLLYQALKEEKESVDYLTGTKKKFNNEARILISTYSKSGVGFDHPKLDMMIVASDVDENYEQYFGRCVRREDVDPIFVDLVDKLKSLETHFRNRKNYAVSVGGTVKDFRKMHPDFFVPLQTSKSPEIIFND